MQLNGRSRAVVLGASVGVGAAIMRQLAPNYDLVGFHRGKHRLEADQLRHEIQTSGAACGMFVLDVGSSKHDVDNGLRMVGNRGPVSVMVHSVSGASLGPMLQTSEGGITTTFNRLAHSFLWWVQGLHSQGLLNDNASIIALSNPCPDFYLRNSGVIGAAKAALEAYVRVLAVELGGAGHRVNCVRFSTVKTPALEAVVPPVAFSKLEDLHHSIIPARRMMTADDVAKFVALLVQDQWMNGAIVDLTGGATSTLMDYAFNGVR